MRETIRDLLQHKGYADAAIFHAVVAAGAADEGQLRMLFHHMLVANRFWLLAVIERPFQREREGRPSASFPQLVQRFRDTHAEEMAWIDAATDHDLVKPLAHPLIPGGRCSVTEALLQVCLHSQGHRAQAAKVLRAAGGEPPLTDFIVWRIERPPAAWPE